MTKFCKEKQFARTDSIMEKIQFFKKQPDSGNREQALNLLAQIQQEAMTVGTVMEAERNDYYSQIKELERLCELLYQMSMSLDNKGTLSTLEQESEIILKNLKGELRAVSPKREVVFLPYQVSMWDSLESVWMAAEEDAEADSYVVPIPYYDVLPDGSLGQLHDQSAEYPKDIVITPYQGYLLEERHPDVIFIHNPYDGCNSVTRVPELFYASRIKKCTEQLVYIPYFVSEEGGPSDHFCYMPGVLFADKAVVQPGVIYEKYCRIYTQALKENGWEGILAPAEEKFMPLDSPKFDKILNTSCGVRDVPKHWRNVIWKPDGTRKKIVLYDLTVINLLGNQGQALLKVERVFQLYRERSDEVVLLWRPHPLLLSTINAMRPQLKEAYLMLVRQIQEGNWGIFDNTPDPNLALALSDAYYGDCSSLMTVYRATGKPYKVQDVQEDEEQEFLMEVLKENAIEQKDSNGIAGQKEQAGSRIYYAIMSGSK